MSSGSDSDEDFIPGEPEQLSEEGSADEETELQYEKEVEHKSNKRKAAQSSKGNKRLRKKNSVKETIPEQEEIIDKTQATDPEEEKKREDDLWAMFLEGTDSKPKPVSKEPVPVSKPSQSQVNKDTSTTKAVAKVADKSEDDKARERRIFEFAGETIVVENNVIKEKIKTTDSPGPVPKPEGPPTRKSAGGISSVLDSLNKKNKLSTLEKSKLDWMTYKKEEGIEEEIQSHNKGKSGYLDRKDFLERADYRQYEIERDLRMSRRSNR